jgi:hypothetical protein
MLFVDDLPARRNADAHESEYGEDSPSFAQCSFTCGQRRAIVDNDRVKTRLITPEPDGDALHLFVLAHRLEAMLSSNAIRFSSAAPRDRDRRCLILLHPNFPAKGCWGYFWGYLALYRAHTPKAHTPKCHSRDRCEGS